MDLAKDLGAALAGAPPAQTPRPAAAPADAAAARKTAEQFEAFFMAQTLDSMFAGLSADGMFGGGSGETVYRSLLTQEYGKVATRSGGIGIADAVQREILRLQEVT